MMKNTIGKIAVSSAAILSFGSCQTKKESSKKSETKPNVVVICLDDLGYGDVSAYGGTTLKTPNIDKLANNGALFTDGYATSATCTPSRYGLLTGRYPWRNKDAKILPGTAPLLIDPAMMTMPKMFRKAGYQTALVGKWHLGLGTGVVDWNKRVSPGPNEVGFDDAFYMAATADRVPTVYLKDGVVEGLDPKDPIYVSYAKNYDGEPTGLSNPEMMTMKWHHGHNGTIVNGVPRIGFMKGGKAARWNDETMTNVFLKRAQDYVKNHKDKPFFLYYALEQPHVPRVPNPKFVGKSGLGPRGDVVLEADWAIGEFVKTLEKEGILENTIIVVTSDNGPVLNDGYYDDAVEKLGDHKPWGPLRGGKYSLYEAGARVPFITYWKGHIQPTVSDAIVCQVDLMTSFAKLVGSKIEGPDSENILNAFLGKTENGRETLITEATSRTLLRKGDWILIPPYKGEAVNKFVNIEVGNDNEYQLFNVKEDIGEQNNLAKSNPEKLAEMKKTFLELRGKDYLKNVEKLELK
ncbi:arylsulfatase [Halosquirtibacter laminarini]|uniref:Arylsulfatase n=1 Tax=Halosquirtibacter laminarini TaxID=3374600 RepID=A0AC61NMC3_9BACT|nr:arylsulfatase [Prolixibacteraceae bacterium]